MKVFIFFTFNIEIFFLLLFFFFFFNFVIEGVAYGDRPLQFVCVRVAMMEVVPL